MNGWIGTVSQLEQVLRSFNCDRDPDGKFRVDGPITSFHAYPVDSHLGLGKTNAKYL